MSFICDKCGTDDCDNCKERGNFNMETNLIAFSREVMTIAFERGSVSEEMVSELGIKYGCLVSEPYDPDVHGSDLGFDFAPADTVYVFSEIFNVLREVPSID